MPQKHSKNNGSSTYGVFSYGERKQCSFMSSIDERTGADAQLPFGWCALSLQPAKDPVCTPSGHVYSRESLLEHMVAKGDAEGRAREVGRGPRTGSARSGPAAHRGRPPTTFGVRADERRHVQPTRTEAIKNGALAVEFRGARADGLARFSSGTDLQEGGFRRER